MEPSRGDTSLLDYETDGAGGGILRSMSRGSTLSNSPGGLGKRSKSKKVFRCPMENCGRVFDRKYNMQIHIRKHTGEMPYQCRVDGCGERFKWRSSLVNHNRKHKSGELPGEPDPTLPIPSREAVPEKDNRGGVFFHDQYLDRQATAPCVVDFDENEATMMFYGDFIRPAVQSTPSAGDLVLCSATQLNHHNQQLQQIMNSPNPPPLNFHNRPFDIFSPSDNPHHQNSQQQQPQQRQHHEHQNDSFAEDDDIDKLLLSSAAQGNEPLDNEVQEILFDNRNIFEPSYPLPDQVQEENLESDFIDRFNGALNCDFDAHVIEEAIENPFTSPVSDIFHVNESSVNHYHDQT